MLSQKLLGGTLTPLCIMLGFLHNASYICLKNCSKRNIRLKGDTWRHLFPLYLGHFRGLWSPAFRSPLSFWSKLWIRSGVTSYVFFLLSTLATKLKHLHKTRPKIFSHEPRVSCISDRLTDDISIPHEPIHTCSFLLDFSFCFYSLFYNIAVSEHPHLWKQRYSVRNLIMSPHRWW